MTGYEVPGAVVREHEVTVPLHWSEPDAGTTTVFARELVAPDRRDDDLPLLLFLQGGPGGKSPRPTRGGWVARALRDFRMVLLDQRGTGRSSRVTGRSISRFPDPAAAARHLLAFRADSVVADAEHLRTTVYGGRRWTTLGQSYGGFVTLTYLSQAPEGLERCLVTGGLAGLHADAREVYRRTWPRVAAKTRRFHERYPADAARLAAVADRLDAAPVLLPDGDRLTVRRLQTLGHALGTQSGPEELHWLVDEALDEDGELADGFLDEVARRTSYWDNPLYMTLQEVIYAGGPGATGWAAEAERPVAFDPSVRPLPFTGEMVFPWMFEEIASLRAFGPAARALAEVEEFPALYDPVRLAANDVPVDAAVYLDDMYVDAGLSLETAEAVGNVRAWVTNEFEHDGLRTGDVLDRLLTIRSR
ncbi:alpha/beta fold hydrolase [Modestobacter sp. VKM Ac-2986]|uniref:alpha/beta fold hydrolase n=1 Tax=Modestobacter sp. VKM Ac-2986 TaxID=3004140 RepID=UPI0022AA343B|nr:alpha/beta fold hydrolase [Modestobacter sp. VKM Ac-2986]MCZ2827672.1 alpha/beta fold hydrolase [Modestobacter sp. VKM Ac-2986]